MTRRLKIRRCVIRRRDAMVETTRARRAIERAREAIERAREGARALVDALARDDATRSTTASKSKDDRDDDDRRRRMERAVRRCAMDARSCDAAVRAVRRETSAIGRDETMEAATPTERGDAVTTATRDANARGAVTCAIERTSDESDGIEYVRVSARGAFAARWRRDDPGDAATTTATAEEGRDTAAHAAMTERLLECARGAIDEGLGKDGASVRMVEWLESMHDVFTAPDVAAGGRVLAADASRGGALIPSRLLPGRARASA